MGLNKTKLRSSPSPKFNQSLLLISCWIQAVKMKTTVFRVESSLLIHHKAKNHTQLISIRSLTKLSELTLPTFNKILTFRSFWHLDTVKIYISILLTFGYVCTWYFDTFLCFWILLTFRYAVLTFRYVVSDIWILWHLDKIFLTFRYFWSVSKCPCIEMQLYRNVNVSKCQPAH